jgi:hypothetical protein
MAARRNFTTPCSANRDPKSAFCDSLFEHIPGILASLSCGIFDD